MGATGTNLPSHFVQKIKSCNMLCCIISCYRDVISVLEDWGTERRETEITKITVTGAGVESVNGDYRPVAGDRLVLQKVPSEGS